MGISNLLVKSRNAFPRTLPGKISGRSRRVKRSSVSKQTANTLTVAELLAATQPLPAKSILLGRCPDGLPFFMSMDDPEMGAVLICGASGCGKTHQLQVMVESAMRTHRPHELQITVITHHPSEWQAIQKDPLFMKYLQGVYAWYDPRLETHLQRLTDLAEARREGHHGGPATLVVLDDMNFVEVLSWEAQVNLRWLLEYGSQSRVWLVGAINALQAQVLTFWVEVFRTRLFGWMRAQMAVDLPWNQPGLRAESLEPGTFRAWTGNSWITYQIPLLGGRLKRRV
jgi:hypothetical protein